MNHTVRVESKWQAYGKYAALGIIFLLLAITSWQFREHNKSKGIEQASTEYDSMLKTFSIGKDQEKALQHTAMIIDKYPNSPYAPLSALLQARIFVDQNQLDKAVASLETAINLAKKGPVPHVARIRLARILATEKKYDEALKVLTPQKEVEEAYIALYEEAKGDIYVAQNEMDKARAAYKLARTAVPPQVKTVPLQLKLNDINIEETE